MTSDSPATGSSPSTQRNNQWRFFPCFILFVLFLLLFIGGTAAFLYWLFSEYSGVRNIWLLVCGAPLAVVIIVIITGFTLYTRYGRPLRQIFNAIDSVAEGDLSVRVPSDDSPQFGELIKRFNKMVGELERAEQQRRNLTADIAHELRTPLHIIQGNLEGILDGVYQPSSDHINATLDETRLLTRLVNDLQTLSLAETGQLPLHPTRFLLNDLLADLITSFYSQAVPLGIDLKTHIANVDQEATADYDRLNQILSNLISNALRHTPSGGTVSVQAQTIKTQTPDANNNLQIVIRDTGSGIPADDLPFIFDRFWRGDKSRTERMHSGLGLAIAKQLVLAHSGTIEVASEVSKGTTFTIELPQDEILEMHK
jgi:signal transduction histidine kinase